MNRRDLIKGLFATAAVMALPKPAGADYDLGAGDFTVDMWMHKSPDGKGCWIDEFRVSQGIVRYTRNFEVPGVTSEWHHFAVTGAGGVERLYIDGELAETRPSRAGGDIRMGDFVSVKRDEYTKLLLDGPNDGGTLIFDDSGPDYMEIA